MKRTLVMLGLVLFVGYAAVSMACGTSGSVADTEPVGQSTGDKYILNGDGCPDKFTYVRAGGSYGGCRFEPRGIKLYVYCDPSDEYTKSFGRLDNGPVWRSDDEPSERGLQVFWPGGDGVDGRGFACVKERCFDCE